VAKEVGAAPAPAVARSGRAADKRRKYDNAETVVDYPFTSKPAKLGKGSTVVVTGKDYSTLQATEFLNDTVIDFYVKYIENEILEPDQRARCHFFGIYFWKLLSKEGDNAERGHANVCKWTREVNIFEKDFVFVPIVEDLHWTLAIICSPIGIK
jgi:sentrin-specific protease 7